MFPAYNVIGLCVISSLVLIYNRYEQNRMLPEQIVEDRDVLKFLYLSLIVLDVVIGFLIILPDFGILTMAIFFNLFSLMLYVGQYSAVRRDSSEKLLFFQDYKPSYCNLVMYGIIVIVMLTDKADHRLDTAEFVKCEIAFYCIFLIAFVVLMFDGSLNRNSEKIYKAHKLKMLANQINNNSNSLLKLETVVKEENQVMPNYSLPISSNTKSDQKLHTELNKLLEKSIKLNQDYLETVKAYQALVANPNASEQAIERLENKIERIEDRIDRVEDKIDMIEEELERRGY